jgi:hypothetical protein
VSVDKSMERNVIYFLYGFYGEYSLKQFEDFFHSRQIPYVVIANMPEDEIKSILSRVPGTKILLTSAHPYFPRKSQPQREYGAYSLSIATLRNLANWYKIVYVSHDIIEEYKSSERFFANDYDLFCLHFPDNYDALTSNNPVVKLPLPVNPLSTNFVFQAIFFVSEWDYYRFSHSPEEFLLKFPFLGNKDIALKPVSVPGDIQFRENLQSLGVEIIDPRIRAEEILTSFEGIVITNAFSGVAQLGVSFGSSVIVLKDFAKNRFPLDLKKYLIQIPPPFSSNLLDHQLLRELSQKKKERDQELYFPLEETYRLMKVILGI